MKNGRYNSFKSAIFIYEEFSVRKILRIHFVSICQIYVRNFPKNFCNSIQFSWKCKASHTKQSLLVIIYSRSKSLQNTMHCLFWLMTSLPGNQSFIWTNLLVVSTHVCTSHGSTIVSYEIKMR